jgi:hypothetical protein
MQDYSSKLSSEVKKQSYSPQFLHPGSRRPPQLSQLSTRIQPNHNPHNPHNTIAYSININPAPIKIPPSPRWAAPPVTIIRPEQLTNEFIHSLLDNQDLNNVNTIKTFKGLDY